MHNFSSFTSPISIYFIKTSCFAVQPTKLKSSLENVALNSMSRSTDSTKTGLICYFSWDLIISSSNMHFTPLKSRAWT